MHMLLSEGVNILYGDVGSSGSSLDEQFGMMTTDQIGEEIKNGAIDRYLQTLPDKLLEMGIKVFLTFILTFIGIKLIKMIRKLVKSTLTKAGIEKGVIQFTDSLIRTVFGFLLVLWVAVNFGVEATSIAALISSVSIAIGLALQGALSNFAGGILILILKPFKVGDYIKEDSHANEGVVKEITLFYTKLLSYDNKTIILPNGTLANSSMVNYSHDGKRKIDLRLEISYKSDIKEARRVILHILENNDLVIKEMDKVVFVAELGSNGVVVGVRCFTKATDYFNLYWQLLEEIKYGLDKAGVAIPYPQLDVHFDDNSVVNIKKK